MIISGVKRIVENTVEYDGNGFQSHQFAKNTVRKDDRKEENQCIEGRTGILILVE